jgi:hypothetical protein
MGRPVASGLKGGSHVQPDPPQEVFEGTPVLLYGELDKDSDDRVELTWDCGRMDLPVPSGDAETGEAVRLLRGSRLITDWESRYRSEEAVAPLAKRQQSRVARRLVELSKTYGLASREMSLVAVVKRLGDRPGELPDTRVVPVGMAQGTLFSRCFLESDSYISKTEYMETTPLFSRAMPEFASLDEGPELSVRPSSPGLRYSKRRASGPTKATVSDADLVDLAAMLEPDGGMPGDSASVRAGRTIAAAFAFVTHGHTLASGAFRLHVTRLVGFLKSVSVASRMEGRQIERVLEAASTGNAPAGQWLELAREPGTSWKKIEEVLK